jgi:hypothetical protein
MTVTKRVMPRSVVKRLKALKKKTPPGARKGGVVNPERHPVKPKVPGTRDKGFPVPQRRKKRRAPRVK